MCGIMGYVGNKEAVPVIVEGLKKLEYRGYDSAGVAIYNNGSFEVIKRKGRLTVLEEALSKRAPSGHMGIGHTRWATHGEPSNENSHPHLGEKEKIAIVHNGIIENHRQLREKLERKGVSFTSETDSEVIAQLAEYYYRGNILETVIKVVNTLEGSFALGVMCLDEPRLIAVRKDNPLIIGEARDGMYLASDVPAILKHTSQVYYLEDKEIAVLDRSGVEFFNMDGEPVSKSPETVAWSADSAEKGGYQHFMLKEIMEQPKVLRMTIDSALCDGGKNKAVIDSIDIRSYNKIIITGCGSAYHAGVVAKYVFESLCGLSAEVELASELRYRNPLIDGQTLVIFISQSGETADTIAAVREAKRRGAATLSIVNVVGSTIAKETDYVLYTLAGPEIAVATTKAFSAQLVLLYILAARFAQDLGALTGGGGTLAEVSALPDMVESLLADTGKIQQFAATCVGYKSIFFIGRNVDYAISLEGSLKLKEISYIHSEAYAGGELKHGPISLIEPDTLVVAISCCQRLAPKIASNVEQVISRGAKALVIGCCTDYEEGVGDKLSAIKFARINELFSPSLSVIILQLFSYYVAANKGLDIDKPRNLAKSVTVE
ncbi:MAG: glutamine--fructose-6-phosphate transaminase (isomerizing) [Clostridiales bacterium]|jgi:glucosamine--fructose-6-phosphate aminotransferase (isomerizing)|nr:glutamine--fructose-6-phosphate transaminase (isomerizing) [Clostridiales bacterium]